MKLGIIGAMEIEVNTLISAMSQGNSTFRKKASLKFYEGLLFGVPSVIVRSGIGKVNAALCAQCLINEFGVTHIINTGIAGSMATGLAVFDIVLSSDAVYHDVDVTAFGYKVGVIPQMDASVFLADKMLIELAQKAFTKTNLSNEHKILVGRIASGDQFISNGVQKKRIAELFNPACVEMEGAAIAHACYLSDIPFVIIRTMSDMADDGEESAYKFNDKDAAEKSALLVSEMCKLLSTKA
ncbi:MAG: 5'-methylthioadenosine/adenosylhomocysteine nucleosidase [Treponema sp.]|nr:5'-methylthioadenosine/adenosylhomocysteine nucleosidase [Treponema sp.]